MTMQNLTYLFGVTTKAAGFIPDGTGVGGGAVSTAVFNGVAAIFCEVPEDDFTGEAADARMKELPWVAPRAARHEEVILKAMECGPVLPFRFGTVFSSQAVMVETLSAVSAKIAQFLEFISDKDEWDVRGFIDKAGARGPIMEKLLAEGSGDLEKLSPGKRYFMEQRLKAGVEKRLAETLSGFSQDALDRLSETACDSFERKLLGRDVAGGDMDMFYHFAFLVKKTEAGRFAETAASFSMAVGDSRAIFELTGPWPPYSFSPSLKGD
jgi:hypothetical protein